MDVDEMEEHLRYISVGGLTLPLEERMTIENSLSVLREDTKCASIWLIAKILGIQADYYVAMDFGSDALVNHRFYYCTNCVTWSLLQRPRNPDTLKLLPRVRGRFIGDASYEYEMDSLQQTQPPDSSDTQLQLPTSQHVLADKFLVKEEDRLAWTIHNMGQDAAIVPRRALIRPPPGTVVFNPAFKGLSESEGQELYSYFHLRVPSTKWNKNLNCLADGDKVIDFLESLEADEPPGVWTIQKDCNGTCVVLKHLKWPGFVFYHKLGTAKYGFFYIGNGIANMDIPFMLPSSAALDYTDANLPPSGCSSL